MKLTLVEFNYFCSHKIHKHIQNVYNNITFAPR